MNNLPDILQRILVRKREEIIEQKSIQPLASIQALLAENPPPLRGFASALFGRVNHNHFGIIAEIKRASPSKGVLRNDVTPAALARSYENNGATCLSVLTDKDFFQGSIADLITARNACHLPVLRKDFIIDSYQVYQTRAIGADAVLLIAACLDDNELRELITLARALELDVLLEVHDEFELERVLKFEPNLIGINNRDLRTFIIDVNTTLNLIYKIPRKCLLITESGIRNKTDVELMLKFGVRGFLVGEALMSALEPGKQLKELFY